MTRTAPLQASCQVLADTVHGLTGAQKIAWWLQEINIVGIHCRA